MKIKASWLVGAVSLAVASAAHAGLITQRVDTDATGATVDGTVSANEYGTGNAYSFTGGGTGFGGPLGNATMYLQSDATTLYLGFSGLGVAGGADQVVVYLNTKSGGFTTDTNAVNKMTDTFDAGRANISRLTPNGNEIIPFAADYALVFNNRASGGFAAFFELTGGSHNYINDPSVGLGSGSPEFSFSLATLGVSAGGAVDVAAYLISDTSFMSDEGIPATGIGSGNPGFGGSEITLPDYHEFVTVPEPSAVAFIGLGAALVALRRYLRRR